MTKIDLSSVSINQLERELAKREKQERERQEENKRKRLWQDFLDRPSCEVVGKAYGYPGGHAAREYTIGSLTIAGNSSETYQFKVTVAPDVKTYFNNALTREDRSELRSKLKKLAEDFIHSKMNDPAVVTTLICLCHSASKGSEVARELHKEAINRLNLYSSQELKVAKDKLKRNWDTAHGQIELLNEVIREKRKENELSEVRNGS